MPLVYQQSGLSLGLNSAASDLVRALQKDLRALGYLKQCIDGSFGNGTQAAIRALQYDLINHHGQAGSDGAPPVAIANYNRPAPGGGPAVTTITGVLDQALAGCIERLLADASFPQIPSSADPASANTQALQTIRNIASQIAPSPFIAAMIVQESSGQHFRVPSSRDADNFVVVGLDTNGAPDQITSRGYGIGQYTIFHHPPQVAEVNDFILDPARNVQKAFRELRDKFDNFILSSNVAIRADDRLAEHPSLPLRLCKYSDPNDPRYMRDCRACAVAARKIDIRPGMAFYPGYTGPGYQADHYYPSASYDGVPDRADFLCDWPYAARRYNGSGNDSFHYQARILSNLLKGS